MSTLSNFREFKFRCMLEPPRQEAELTPHDHPTGVWGWLGAPGPGIDLPVKQLLTACSSE